MATPPHHCDEYENNPLYFYLTNNLVLCKQKQYILGPKNLRPSGIAQPRRAMGRSCFKGEIKSEDEQKFKDQGLKKFCRRIKTKI